MTMFFAIGLSVILWVPLFARAQADSSTKTTLIHSEYGKPVSLSEIGITRLVLKDGSIKKDCLIREINEYWIVYEKGGSLHDQMIEKIRRIEIGKDKAYAIFFNDKNKPILKRVQY